MDVQRYRDRISGPLLDRIDIHVEVPAVQYQDLTSKEARANLPPPSASASSARARSSETRFASHAENPLQRPHVLPTPQAATAPSTKPPKA